MLEMMAFPIVMENVNILDTPMQTILPMKKYTTALVAQIGDTKEIKMPKPYGMTTKSKIDHWIRQLKPGQRFTRRQIERDLNVSSSTVNYALREFAANNRIEKSNNMRGRNSEWRVLK